MSAKQRWCLIYLILSTITACVSSTPSMQMGLQPKYDAVNPSRILAIPPFNVPDPSRKVKIEISAEEGGKMFAQIEQAVLEAFSKQPAVNGVTFNAVRKEVGKNSALLNNLEIEINAVTKLLASRDPLNHSAFSKQCIERKNFVEFYNYCVATTRGWKEALNALSAKIFNADSALIVVVTEAEKREVDSKYETRAGLAILLVDTNNGNLIWGRSVDQIAKAKEGKKTFPEWTELIPSMLGEKFWLQFPGRKLLAQ